MADLSFEHVCKRYGAQTIVSDFDLRVADGTFVVLVGGSGCGKSTTLRMLAGLESVSEGAIRIGAREVTHLPPGQRDVAMVFQDYALYPHLTVRQNIDLGLRLRKVPKSEIERRVGWATDTLELAQLLDRKPAQLSGGQRQRVAMGRAMVREPQAFLFDEPLSNLDAKLRGQMRVEIMRLQRRLGITTLYVTHDQVEAMTLADVLVVLDAGKIQQVGRPMDVYRAPANRFVAGFIGSPTMNFIEGSLEERDGGPAFVAPEIVLPMAGRRLGAAAAKGRVTLGLRPDEIALASDAPGAPKLTGRVVVAERLGGTTHLHVEVGPHRLVAVIPSDRDLPADASVELAIDPARAHLFAEDGRAALVDATAA